MAEVAGLLGLAGLFNNAVDWFQYIRLARTLGSDLQFSVLEVDIVQLRLARWGKAVGISDEIVHAKSLTQSSLAGGDIEKAEEILGMIVKLLEDAKEISNKYGRGNTTIQVFEASQASMDPPTLSAHEKMRQICRIRQGKAGLISKTKWALYTRDHLDKLLEQVTSLIDDLVTLFPAAQAASKSLYESDATDLGSYEGAVGILKGAAAGRDHDLAVAMQRKTKKQETYTLNIYGKVGQQVGQQNITGGLTISGF